MNGISAQTVAKDGHFVYSEVSTHCLRTKIVACYRSQQKAVHECMLCLRAKLFSHRLQLLVRLRVKEVQVVSLAIGPKVFLITFKVIDVI
jgi:hypothetical protein